MDSSTSRFWASVPRASWMKWLGGTQCDLPACHHCGHSNHPGANSMSRPTTAHAASASEPQNASAAPRLPRPHNAQARQPLPNALRGVIRHLQVQGFVHHGLDVALRRRLEVTSTHEGVREERTPSDVVVLQVAEEMDARLASLLGAQNLACMCATWSSLCLA